MLSDVTREDLEVYVGKWFEKTDPETETLCHLLSNGKKALALKVILENDLVRKKLRELGFELIYKRNGPRGDQKRRWTIVGSSKIH